MARSFLRPSNSLLSPERPCLVSVGRLPRPSRSMPFGDVTETNGPRDPKRKARYNEAQRLGKRMTTTVYPSGHINSCLNFSTAGTFLCTQNDHFGTVHLKSAIGLLSTVSHNLGHRMSENLTRCCDRSFAANQYN